MIAPESIVIELEWDFGDGKKSQCILTRHAYERVGTHEVFFKVKDNFGN